MFSNSCEGWHKRHRRTDLEAPSKIVSHVQKSTHTITTDVHDFSLRVSKEKSDILYTVQLTTYQSDCLQDLCDILKPLIIILSNVLGLSPSVQSFHYLVFWWHIFADWLLLL